MKAELTALLQVDVGKVMMSENTRYTAGHHSPAAIRKSWLLVSDLGSARAPLCFPAAAVRQGALLPFTHLCMLLLFASHGQGAPALCW